MEELVDFFNNPHDRSIRNWKLTRVIISLLEFEQTAKNGESVIRENKVPTKPCCTIQNISVIRSAGQLGVNTNGNPRWSTVAYV